MTKKEYHYSEIHNGFTTVLHNERENSITYKTVGSSFNAICYLTDDKDVVFMNKHWIPLFVFTVEGHHHYYVWDNGKWNNRYMGETILTPIEAITRINEILDTKNMLKELKA